MVLRCSLLMSLCKRVLDGVLLFFALGVDALALGLVVLLALALGLLLAVAFALVAFALVALAAVAEAVVLLLRLLVLVVSSMFIPRMCSVVHTSI